MPDFLRNSQLPEPGFLGSEIARQDLVNITTFLLQWLSARLEV